jgi:hypothetical protein
MITPSGDVATAAAVAVCGLLAALAVFQSALIAGAPLGRLAWGGADRVLPRHKRIGSAVSIALYVAFALIVLRRADLLPVLPDGFAAIAVWVLAAYFLVGVAMNAASRSKPERWTMSPLCLVRAVLTVLVALGG